MNKKLKCQNIVYPLVGTRLYFVCLSDHPTVTLRGTPPPSETVGSQDSSTTQEVQEQEQGTLREMHPYIMN